MQFKLRPDHKLDPKGAINFRGRPYKIGGDGVIDGLPDDMTEREAESLTGFGMVKLDAHYMIQEAVREAQETNLREQMEADKVRRDAPISAPLQQPKKAG